MKMIIVLAVVLSAFGTAAEGYLGEVVSYWQAPTRGVRGLAVGPDYIYLLIRKDPNYRVWTCNLTNGSVIRSWAVTVYERGLGYQNPGYIWTRWNTSMAFKRRESDGIILASFRLNLPNNTGGLDCQGDPDVPNSVTAIIANITDWANPTVYRYTTVGSFISSFRHYSGPNYTDCAWDYGNNLIWITDSHDNGYVYAFTTAGSRSASFPGPRRGTTTTKAYASCYKSGYLYIGGFLVGTAIDLIWKVHCPATVNVRPASLGKVKAVYR